jgi:hypothetical protein
LFVCSLFVRLFECLFCSFESGFLSFGKVLLLLRLVLPCLHTIQTQHANKQT